jgi:hypothetical protein
MIPFLSQILPVLQTVFILALMVGSTFAGVFVYKSTKRNGIVSIQSETIVAMQQQIDALKAQNTQQQEKIDHLEFEAKATREALQDEYGIFITVDGERVTIKNSAEPDTRHIIRRPTKKPATKKAED